jgi:hypothetical protein
VSAATVYNLALFLHVVGALGIAAAYATDTIGLAGLRHSVTAEEARTWLTTRRWVLVIGPASVLLVLVSGIYMMAAQWGFVPWLVVAIASLVAIAVVGGVLTGIPISRVSPAIAQADGLLSQEVRRALRGLALTFSVTIRIAITIGIVFLMVLKPGWIGSIAAIGIASACAGAAGLALAARPETGDARPEAVR